MLVVYSLRTLEKGLSGGGERAWAVINMTSLEGELV